jgi:hypothetical protein
MPEAPLLIDIDENIGPEKDPGELILLDVGSGVIGGLSAEERAERLEKRPNADIGADSNVGPQKHPDELILAEILDLNNEDEQFLSDFAKDHPKAATALDGPKDAGKNEELRNRATLETLLGLQSGSLSNKENFAGQVFLSRSVGPNRDEEEAPSLINGLLDGPAPQRFRSIEDLRLSPSQLQRYQDLVDQGEIDEDQLFGSGLSGIPNPIGVLMGKGNSGISMQQALAIVMGNEREGISQFNPHTGQTYTTREVSALNKLRQELLIAQGFAPLNLDQVMGVGKQRFNFQLLPRNERRVLPDGSLASGLRHDNLTNALTLEEQLLVMELYTGRARLHGDPRAPENRNDPDINESILFGDFVL